ncbi:MAG: N-acetylmuramoyl-L-alanine amidase-like domain-containing protein [Mangrovibacterium sp.]
MKNIKQLYLLILIFSPMIVFSHHTTLTSEPYHCSQDINEELYKKHFSSISTEDDISARTIAIAQSFIGTPYKENTLDININEQLIVNIANVDCTTFVEYVLAIAMSDSYTQFSAKLQAIRYRQGKIIDYTSRLHYFSDWIYENIQNGTITCIDSSFQETYLKKINFMSSHADSYPLVKGNSVLIHQLAEIEKQISLRHQHYIPKDKVQTYESTFKDGDLVAITTNIEGLDVVHVGFIIFKNKRAHLLHASSNKNEVTISNEPLSDYLAKSKNKTGIMIVRPNNFQANKDTN